MIISSLPGEDSTTQYSKITFFNKGGMGEIYKAWDDTNKKDVAIKLIAILDSADEELLSREIDISSKLISENIVKTNYTGKTDISGVSYFYIVQDFYDNGNLRGAIRSGIPLDECFAMMNDILTGLQAAHSKIIHRDLKPENILIDASGKLVITDFGLAKYIGEKTKTKSFKGGGTIPYMAPECWLLDTNSISMDIYSLGIMFYELLTGKLPINSKSETDWRDFHVYQSLPDISLLRADVSIKLKQIISKMTQKRVQDRYKNTAEIVAALNEVVEQNVQDRKEAERLARIGHSTVMHIQATKLKERQEEDRINEYKKMLNYHIIELFDKLKDIINSVNSSMELEKINIEEHPFNGDLTKRGITISFNDKKISFRFYHHDVIQRYENQRSEDHRNYQKGQHGFVVPQIGKSEFGKREIIYLGKVEANFKSPFLQERFGYNLALVKKDTEIYGKWYIASFSDSGFSGTNRKNFALELNNFLKHFELSFITHVLSVDYHELLDNDLSRTVEEILR